MATVTSFEELKVWQNARALSKNIFAQTIVGSFSKDFRLRDQINASACSIMDNIAEGFERDGKKEFVQFLSISKGSAGELRSQLYTALDRGYIDELEFNNRIADIHTISKQLSTLIKYLNKAEYKGIKFAR